MKLPKYFWHTIFVVMVLIATGLSIWFVWDIQGLYTTGNLRVTRGLHRNHIYGGTMQPNQIAGWMTFSYINYVFHLPPTYLSDSLSIQNSKYPNIEINQYVKAMHMNSASFLQQVEMSVEQYTNPSSK